ncbi:hypothetical protein JTE90_005536 [Oedothorax gibbosus]|uniref:Inositol monophosphatase n=1 Tax=Oedothorax gibbosus TaxID=931172 RepID=A0AAV6V8V7_9ARAC|nr:hypothetical protein JTE90_005536 [Oedothorax gibbosus]
MKSSESKHTFFWWIVLGVVYNPILNQMYTGVKGKGAFCNGKPLKVSNVQNLSEALVIADCGSTRTKESLDQMFANFRQVTEKAHGLQILGSAALNMCMVASGEGDAYFEYTLHCWDMAAEKIIVEEAGGVKSYLCLFSTACYITLQTAATHLTPKRQIIKCGTKKVHIWEVEKFSSIVQQVLSLSYST